MRWLKHMTDTWNDEKIALLVGSGGMQGLAAYGLWWRVVEIVAAAVGPDGKKNYVTYPVARWSLLLSLRGSLVMSSLSRLGVTGGVTVERHGSDITVTIRNLLKYRDEYTRKSGHSPTLTTATATELQLQQQQQKNPESLPSIKPTSEYPQTAFSLREKFPETDDRFVMSLVQNTVQAVISLDGNPLLGELSDELIAAAVRKSWKKSQKTAGLFLTTVPQCVKTFLTQELPLGFRDDPGDWVCRDCGCGPQCFCNGSPEPVSPEKRRKPNGKVARLHGSAV